jgi:hypothetical protein
VITLSTEEEVMEFLENSPKIWREDHTGGIVMKDKEL